MYGKYVHQYAFDYLEQFWNNYNHLSKFAMIMLNEGHEGTGEVIGLVDDDVHNLLSEGYKQGKFDNTALIFLSDHGLHMGAFYMLRTYSGRIENSLPLLDIVLPSWFLQQYPEVDKNLMENQQKLVIGPDIFESLEHLIQYPQKSKPVFSGLSFLEELPDRDCNQAKISNSFCKCEINGNS